MQPRHTDTRGLQRCINVVVHVAYADVNGEPAACRVALPRQRLERFDHSRSLVKQETHHEMRIPERDVHIFSFVNLRVSTDSH